MSLWSKHSLYTASPEQTSGRTESVQQRKPRNNSNGNVQAAAQTLNQKSRVSTPELQVTNRRQLKHQNIHQFPRCLAATSETFKDQYNLENTTNSPTTHYTTKTLKTNVASQTLWTSTVP